MQTATENNVAPIPGACNDGNGKADQVSTSGLKAVSTWRKIGRIERIAEGLQLTFSDTFGGERIVYITRRDVLSITQARIPGDVCTIKDTGNELIISNVGKAFRSRTGRALVVRVPWFSCDIMTPWSQFLKVMEGNQQKAPISIIQSTPPAREAPRNRTMSISAGLEMGF